MFFRCQCVYPYSCVASMGFPARVKNITAVPSLWMKRNVPAPEGEADSPEGVSLG